MAEMPKHPTYKRILLKLSGESLLADRQYGISTKATEDIAQQIKEIRDMGVEVALVIGGGNIFRGLAGEKSGIERATGDYMGMLATVINGLALQDALEKAGCMTRMHSSIEMRAVCEPYIRRRAIQQMSKGNVVILTAGLGNPYVTTDTGAALRSLELKCDIVMKGTKVDGVYDKDPKKYKEAKRFKTITHDAAIKNDSIRVMDNSALSLCMDQDMPILVFDFFKKNALKKAVMGEDIGTMICC